MGNSRVRRERGELSYKEKRWALNHPIQATASLISKDALRGIASEFGAEHIVLPMHDAMLLQFHDDGEFSPKVSRAKEIMIRAFKQWIPAVEPNITVGAFAEG